jgi:hypothetical protein
MTPSIHSSGNKEIEFRFLHNVRYEDIAPSLDRFALNELPMAAVITKPTCWAYEQEVRMIKRVGDQLFDVPVDTIKEVVFGAEMANDRVYEILVKSTLQESTLCSPKWSTLVKATA